MKTILELAYNYHKEWILVVKSFGGNPSQAEDIVSEMYLQLDEDQKKGLDFTYKNDINKYYCYKILRGIFFTLHKKKGKVKKVYLEEMSLEPKELYEKTDTPINEVNYAMKKKKADEMLNQMFWYDRKVYKILASGKSKSVASLSRDSGISYYSLYNTYTKAKLYIKSKI